MRPAPILTVLAAFMLEAMPLPPALALFKPDFVAVTLIYWSLAAPPALGLVSAFLVGLALDTLTGSLLGQHGFCLMVIVYLTRKFRLRLRAFPAMQSMLVIAGLLAINEFLFLWIDGVAGRSVTMSERWPPIASGTLLWVLIWSTFDRGRERAPARL